MPIQASHSDETQHNRVLQVEHLRFAYSGCLGKQLNQSQTDASPAFGICVEQFALHANECVGLYGPSGSGKSTVLNLLGGVLHAQGGRLSVCGHAMEQASVFQRDRMRADHMGFVFQQFNLLNYLNVMQNVALPCKVSAMRHRNACEAFGSVAQAAETLLNRLGLAGFAQVPVHRLSVGQQQRVALARALMGRPAILFADEPTSALDTNNQEQFMHLLMEEASACGAAVVLVSHDERLQRHMQRVVNIDEWRC